MLFIVKLFKSYSCSLNRFLVKYTAYKKLMICAVLTKKKSTCKVFGIYMKTIRSQWQATAIYLEKRIRN